MFEDLLTGLGGQVAEPLPTRQRVGAGGPELTVDLGYWRPLGNAAVAAGVPLVQEVPERAGRMSLPIKRRGLEGGRINPSTMRSVPHLTCRHKFSTHRS